LLLGASVVSRVPADIGRESFLLVVVVVIVVGLPVVSRRQLGTNFIVLAVVVLVVAGCFASTMEDIFLFGLLVVSMGPSAASLWHHWEGICF